MDLIAENITMTYNDAGHIVKVFSNISLQVKSGCSLAIVGNSGVGKTTLLNLLGGLEKPVSGKVCIGNSACFLGDSNPEFRAKNFGFVFQSHNLLADFTAKENVMMPLLILGEKDAENKALKILDHVGLSNRTEHRTNLLSGGEQQRVAIARAMVAKPSVILADEPTGNLDRENANMAADLLLGAEGISVVLVTHSMELAERMQNIVRLTSEGLTLVK